MKMNSNGVVEYEAIPDKGEVPMKLLLTISEATHVLAISRSKLYDLLNSGHLPSVHIGRSRRVRMQDIEEFVRDGGHAY
jgi:excisionase family DNA binding protein